MGGRMIMESVAGSPWCAHLEARLVVITDGGDGFTAATLREILARRGLRVGAVGWNATGPEGRLELSVRTWFRNGRQADELVQAIAGSPGVIGLAVAPARDDAATETLRD